LLGPAADGDRSSLRQEGFRQAKPNAHRTPRNKNNLCHGIY
jgi:hypothetical protein